MREHYFWWRDIYDTYKEKGGYGGHDNEGAIYCGTVVSVVKV
jgi:hypothetical protein